MDDSIPPIFRMTLNDKIEMPRIKTKTMTNFLGLIVKTKQT